MVKNLHRIVITSANKNCCMYYGEIFKIVTKQNYVLINIIFLLSILEKKFNSLSLLL
jgi:hypothetical protein